MEQRTLVIPPRSRRDEDRHPRGQELTVLYRVHGRDYGLVPQTLNPQSTEPNQSRALEASPFLTRLQKQLTR